MSATSLAIGLERVSRVVGYIVKGANFATTSPNLPMRIAILAEANTANQSGLDTNPQEITSAREAGEDYGYGSPIHMAMRILRPFSGDGVGGIPTVVYPQAAAVGATAKILTITPAGFSRGSGIHYLKICGRDGVDGERYAINIAYNDTVADITAKIADAINNVLGSPVTAESTDYEVTCTTKWKGKTANDVTISVDTGDDDFELSYAIAVTQAGSGTPSITAALALFGDAWNTIVLNSYGLESGIMTDLESVNGKPDPNQPTGRYIGQIFKPFIAVTGSVSDDPSAITDARSEEVTIAVAPAPASSGLQFEAAANMIYLLARQAQDTPHLDVSGRSYPDMPVPTDGLIGTMADYEERDAIVKKGCSTVALVSNRYQVQDFTTTYHKQGEVPPQFRYVRNLIIDFNVRYSYLLKEQVYVIDHTLAANDAVVDAANVIKPKQWLQVVQSLADDLELRAIITEKSFMQDSITVSIGESNPDRFETFFRYKRSGFARVVASTAEAGFNFG